MRNRNRRISYGDRRDYFGVRYYDARVGRFLSVDPAEARFPNWTSYHYSFNSPIRFWDPTGMAPSIYLNEHGETIGDDNNGDDRVFVTDEETINSNTEAGSTNWGAVQGDEQTVLVPSPGVISSIFEEINTNAGPNNEVGGDVYRTPGGNEVNVNAIPGVENELKASDQQSVHVETCRAQNPDQPGLSSASYDYSWHAHPSGSLTVRKPSQPGVTVFGGSSTTFYWGQPPSQEDRVNWRGPRPNIVIGLGSARHEGQRVYFYNRSGVIRSLPLGSFKGLGK